MRISHNQNFLDIAIEEYKIFTKQLQELKDLKAVGCETIEYINNGELVQQDIYAKEDEIFFQKGLMERTCIKIIIFLAIYLEAYIWDFGANCLGESYMEKHLDKLSTISKWEIIPLLVTGKKLKLKEHQLGIFKNLITERNKLIHHKSIEIYPYIGKVVPKEKFPKDLISIWERLNICKFFEFIKYLMVELQKIDENGLHTFKIESMP